MAGPNKVILDYQPSIELKGINSVNKIGIFSFIDNRENIDVKAYGTIVSLLTAELPIAFETQIKTETIISNYITNAFRNELKSIGFKITDGNVYSKTLPFNKIENNLKEFESLDVDKIIVGRIRFFRWTESNFAGLLFQGLMPKPRLSAEIQVQVIDKKSMKIQWAASGCALEKSAANFPKNDERKSKIILGLNKTLKKIISNDGFLNALMN